MRASTTKSIVWSSGATNLRRAQPGLQYQRHEIRMNAPDLRISDEAVDHVREMVAAWPGDARDLALALSTMGSALLLIIDGRDDQIAMYEAAAKAITHASTRPALNG
ncbi:hypothetical protein [Methylobacterium sp. WL6]|uniref:hypothetical protein n=1 Tax=Methylobacterium sp. WL6 TaxID=2603901 RepID=UPI0011C779DE|nr:hypothetical protein [Methylobacterium sp. WL6]TXN72965.1 hypothetical protein FV230_02930 [Methylobacterium sp. WL6]